MYLQFPSVFIKIIKVNEKIYLDTNPAKNLAMCNTPYNVKFPSPSRPHSQNALSSYCTTHTVAPVQARGPIDESGSLENK